MPAAFPTALLGETFVRPTQWRSPRDVSADSRGVRALYARLLQEDYLVATERGASVTLEPRPSLTRPPDRSPGMI